MTTPNEPQDNEGEMTENNLGDRSDANIANETGSNSITSLLFDDFVFVELAEALSNNSFHIETSYEFSYDEVLIPEHFMAIATLYSIYQMEALGLFRAVIKLQEEFMNGMIFLSNDAITTQLYKYDRDQVLQHTTPDRFQAYKCVFGYTNVPLMANAQPNIYFHRLFSLFNANVSQFFHDKQLANVDHPQLGWPNLESVAAVRRAGLDLRNNLKNAFYENISMMVIELNRLLHEAIDILNANEIRSAFGSNNVWKTIEIILQQLLGESSVEIVSRRQIAASGHRIIQWLAQPYILQDSPDEFETLLMQIADDSENWLISAQMLSANQ